jgi:hypothetical protein
MNATHIAPETITDLEFTPAIPCGGTTHHTGKNAHILGQLASQAVTSPCCGFRLLLCQGRGDHLRYRADTIHCSNCDRDSKAWLWRFLPF